MVEQAKERLRGNIQGDREYLAGKMVEQLNNIYGKQMDSERLDDARKSLKDIAELQGLLQKQPTVQVNVQAQLPGSIMESMKLLNDTMLKPGEEAYIAPQVYTIEQKAEVMDADSGNVEVSESEGSVPGDTGEGEG
jgi:hypothetical protein